jgi:hypothetical protein
MSLHGCPKALPTGFFVPVIPDWAKDGHTLAGKRLGRGLDYFRSEGAKLVPPPTANDPYEDESLSAVGDQAAGQVSQSSVTPNVS